MTGSVAKNESEPVVARAGEQVSKTAKTAKTGLRAHPVIATLLGIALIPVVGMLVGSLVVTTLVVVSALTGTALPPALHALMETGAIGDTFGGLLGPLLSTLAVGAAITIGVVQTKHSKVELKQATEQFMSEQNASQDQLERARADQVVAWVAETDISDDVQPHLGVVVSNGSESLVRDLDLIILVDRYGDAIRLRNRESVVPPGTWFLQINRAEVLQSGGDIDGNWPIPVAIDTNGHLRVRLPAYGKSAGTTDFSLRVHPREKTKKELNAKAELETEVEAGAGDEEYVVSPYFSVEVLRFDLMGHEWWRDLSGRLSKTMSESAPTTSEVWEEKFAELALTPRKQTTRANKMHGKNPEVQKAISEFVAALLSKSVDSVQWKVRHPAPRSLRSFGIVELRISGGGQGVAFFNNAKESVLWLAGSGATGIVPSTLETVKQIRDKRQLTVLRKKLVATTSPEEMANAFVAGLAEEGITFGGSSR